MYRITHVTPVPGGDAWLITTPTHAALYEAGFAFGTEQTISSIRRELAGRRLDYILLSHSHYDHASGAAAVKAAFPDAVVCGSDYCRYVFTRPGALKTIREMNDNAAKLAGLYPYDDTIDQLQVERVVREADTIDLGDLQLTVWQTPGHTKCSLSFFDSREGLFLSSETLGAPAGEPDPKSDYIVAPACMAGVASSLKAIRRAVEAAPDKLLLPHYQIVEGTAAAVFLRRAEYWMGWGRDMVLEGHRQGKSQEALMAAWKEKFYTPAIADKQPEAAFDLNVKNIIPAILREYGVDT